MRLGYTIVYVPNVEASLRFFEIAFGLKRKFVTPDADYGELDTGGMTLSFAVHALAESHFVKGYVRADASELPLGMEIALVTDDVAAAHRQALAHGASELCAPSAKP